MTLRVAINGRFLTRTATGVDRFAAELLAAWLPRYSSGKAVRIVLPARAKLTDEQALGCSMQRVGVLNGHFWEQLELPIYCHDEVLLSLCNAGPIAHYAQFIVLHDASIRAYPSAYSLAYRSWYNWLFGQLMRRAAIVATVSKFSALELARHWGTTAREIEVIYESGEHILRASADLKILQRLDLIGKRYVLVVGSHTQYKNFRAAIVAAEALSDINFKVVAVGGSNSRVFSGAHLSSERLVMAGYVSDGELRALYEHAQCFLFPSLYEGFGLPTLEAMHCGCPVLVSRRASMPEVCGEAAVYFEPDDPEDIARQLRRVLSSEAMRDELREAGSVRARLYTWARAAEQLDYLLIRNFGR
jgi:glycosyltransferase involved in cell wall biosynthesis